jgi:hypothetical protein
MVSLLPQAWVTACRVFGAPPVTGKAPTAVVDSGEAPGAVDLASEDV